MPAAVLEAVVAHELCHTVWRTHGPRFQALLRRVHPDADRARGFLDGAAWFARNGKAIPATDLGPLDSKGSAEHRAPSAEPGRDGGYLFPPGP